MTNEMTRCVKINDWIFEVKVVRALRVSQYGEPYSAIANIAFNGDNAFIDGIMLKDHNTLNGNDYQTLKKFCYNMDINHVDIEQVQDYHLTSTPDYSKAASNG